MKAQTALRSLQSKYYGASSDSGRVTCECWGPVGPWFCIKEERED
jgi:hypothetical protein